MNKKVLCMIFSLFMMLVISNVNAAELKKVSSDLTLTENLKESIVITSGSKVILDLAGFNITNTENEHTIIVEKGATLTVKGKGIVNNVSNKKATLINDGTVTIEGGTFSRKDLANNSYYVILNHGKMTIKDGIFQVQNGISSLIDNGYYTASDNKDGTMADLVIDGGIFNMSANNKYIKNDDYGIMTINGGTFNMLVPSSAVVANMGFASGKELLTVNGGTFNYAHTNYAIWDYDWNKEGYKDNSVTVVNGGTFNLTNSAAKITNVEFIKAEDPIKEYPVLGEENVTIVVKESELKQKVEVQNVEENQLPSEDIAKVKEKAGKDYTILAFYEIDLYKALNNTIKVEKITEASNEVSVTLPKPASIPEIKEGFERKYYVIRVHNGVTDILDATLNEDGTISFKTDKFSTYTLTYKDTKIQKTNNPNTFDGILNYVAIALVSVVGMATTTIYFKKRVF